MIFEEPDKIKNLRKKAYSTFEKLDIPSQVYGNGIKLELNMLDTDDINPLIAPISPSRKNSEQIYSYSSSACQAQYKRGSEEKCIICPLKEAIKKYPDKLIQYFASVVPYDENKFISLHYSAVKDGLFIYVPKNKNITITIKSTVLSKSQFEHILVIADELSNVTIIEENGMEENKINKDENKETYRGNPKRSDYKNEDNSFNDKINKNEINVNSDVNSEANYFRHQIVELIAKQSSKVNYITMQQLPKNVVSFSTKRSFQESDSSVVWTNVSLGSIFDKVDVQSLLAEQGAKSQHYGLYFGRKNQMFDIYAANVHRKPHTISDIKIRIALDDDAKALFRGLIRIDPFASNSEGYQKEDTLLLSENAEANAIPNLEIENHDVRCSHGATISQLDKEQLFYITSRGLSKKVAKQQLTLAFMQPVIKELPLEMISKINQMISEKIFGKR